MEMEDLLAIPKSAFQKYFEDWKKRWDKCIISEEVYFEGDKIVIDKETSKQNLLAIIKRPVSEVFRGLEKTLT